MLQNNTESWVLCPKKVQKEAEERREGKKTNATFLFLCWQLNLKIVFEGQKFHSHHPLKEVWLERVQDNTILY